MASAASRSAPYTCAVLICPDGQALLAEGRRTEAGEQFERALAFYREVGAARYANQCEQAFADTA